MAPLSRAGETTFSDSDREVPWGALIPEEQWQTFVSGAAALDRAGLEYLLHGAMALATYTGRWRNTKDVDIVIRPEQRDAVVAALKGVGFEDYFPQQEYDRSWIFRGFKEGVLFDLIWDLPNHRVAIDEQWFERAVPIRLHGRHFSAVPAEELIRAKLYVLQRERCDWVDVLNVLSGAAPRLDWAYLVQRMGRDAALLQGVLAVFNWLCPDRAEVMPPWLRTKFALHADPVADPIEAERRRVRLFDSRPWFALHQPLDQPLER